MKAIMKALIIQDDRDTMDDIFLAFQICLPETELVCANLGVKGLELCKSLPLDIVILDMAIPDMSGFDVIKQIRNHSQVPVIVLSSSKDEPDEVRSLELWADVYMAKPFRQLEFVARVRALLRKNIVQKVDK
jgi:DNA-binding response OmpR family regulator